MHKHFKRDWFTQAIYLHILLNISKHYLAKNADHLRTVCVACWNFAPHCMKLLGNLTIWPTVLDWCLAVSFLQLRLGHYRAVASGGPVVLGSPIWNLLPHFTFGSLVAAYIQFSILKMWPTFLGFGPSFWFLVPPAAKSWRRAWSLVMKKLRITGIWIRKN